MKYRFLIVAVVIALFSGLSHADSTCQSGVTFDTIMAGGPCTIGNTEFNLTPNVGNSYASTTIFTTFTTSTSVGFTFTGVFGAFFDTLYATPLSGGFTSYSCSSPSDSACFLYGSVLEASDVNGSLYSLGIPEATLTPGGLEVQGPGAATYTFNESDPGPTAVPEGSELAMLGISAIGIITALKRKFLLAR